MSSCSHYWNALMLVRVKLFELQYLQDKGVYGTDDLYNRGKMYDQIESYVKMMKQDLTALFLELEDR